MSDEGQLHTLLRDEGSKSYQVVAAVRDTRDRGAKAIGLVVGSSFASSILAAIFVEKGNWTYVQSFFVILLVFALGWATLASIKLAVQPALSSALFRDVALSDSDWSDILLAILKKTEDDVRHLTFALVCVVGATMNIVLFSNALLFGNCKSEFARTVKWATFVCSSPNTGNEK